MVLFERLRACPMNAVSALGINTTAAIQWVLTGPKESTDDKRQAAVNDDFILSQPASVDQHFNTGGNRLSQSRTINRIDLIGRPCAIGTTVLHTKHQYRTMPLLDHTDQFPKMLGTALGVSNRSMRLFSAPYFTSARIDS